jgi:NifU-like protein involved in Fe-S cluster formation
MEHFEVPNNRGTMECPDFVGTGSLSGYPPFVTLYLRIESSQIADATFQAEGCGVTIACGSALTELVKRRSIVECLDVTVEQLSEALDGLPVGKEYCAEVAIAALRDAISNWK